MTKSTGPFFDRPEDVRQPQLQMLDSETIILDYIKTQMCPSELGPASCWQQWARGRFAVPRPPLIARGPGAPISEAQRSQNFHETRHPQGWPWSGRRYTATPTTPRHHGAGEARRCQPPALTPHRELPRVPEQTAWPGSGPLLGPRVSGMGKAAPIPGLA